MTARATTTFFAPTWAAADTSRRRVRSTPPGQRFMADTAGVGEGSCTRRGNRAARGMLQDEASMSVTHRRRDQRGATIAEVKSQAAARDPRRDVDDQRQHTAEMVLKEIAFR